MVIKRMVFEGGIIRRGIENPYFQWSSAFEFLRFFGIEISIFLIGKKGEIVTFQIRFKKKSFPTKG